MMNRYRTPIYGNKIGDFEAPMKTIYHFVSGSKTLPRFALRDLGRHSPPEGSVLFSKEMDLCREDFEV
jgi:hypothetical protein